MKVFKNLLFHPKIFMIKKVIVLREKNFERQRRSQKMILREDALTNSEEGVEALTKQLVLQGLETFTFLIDDK